MSQAFHPNPAEWSDAVLARLLHHPNPQLKSLAEAELSRRATPPPASNAYTQALEILEQGTLPADATADIARLLRLASARPFIPTTPEEQRSLSDEERARLARLQELADICRAFLNRPRVLALVRDFEAEGALRLGITQELTIALQQARSIGLLAYISDSLNLAMLDPEVRDGLAAGRVQSRPSELSLALLAHALAQRIRPVRPPGGTWAMVARLLEPFLAATSARQPRPVRDARHWEQLVDRWKRDITRRHQRDPARPSWGDLLAQQQADVEGLPPKA
jgi:hypothetical protein